MVELAVKGWKLILAIGILINPRRPIIKRTIAGFSLLELLIVLMIIGIISGAITFSINPRGNDCKNEARRFLELVELAIDEAILKSEEYGITFPPEGYLFVRHFKGEWQSFSPNSVFRRRLIPASIDIELFVDGEIVNIKNEENFSSREERLPFVYLYSSGEVSPFSLFFMDPVSGAKYQVLSDLNDGIKLLDNNKDN